MTKRIKTKATSEFGKGLCYFLALFLEHKHKLHSEITIYKDIQENEWVAVESWFNGAADHFFEFDAENAPEKLRKRCKILKDKCIGWRYCGSDAKREDAEWAIEEAEEIIRLIDESHGIPTIESTWR